jgi:hypothetical protein
MYTSFQFKKKTAGKEFLGDQGMNDRIPLTVILKKRCERANSTP